MALPKSPTGVPGLDDLTDGGLPTGRCSLVNGGPGCGKTLLALQSLVKGATVCGEPGIFVAFEESADRIIRNAESFGWNLPELQRNGLFFLDAQPQSGMVQSGEFDLGGMLAALEAKAAEMGATRIVFDALDIVLALLDDPRTVRREVYRLHEWLLAKQFTSVLTSKAEVSGGNYLKGSLEFMQFMTDCVVHLSHEVVDGVSVRNLRVVKYRGSGFEENEVPFLIDSEGVVVEYGLGAERPAAPANEHRLTTGIDRLDSMLGGGYHRGASILVTGAPGTAKTTLAGAFAEATSQRGEKVLFVSFDSNPDEIVRNLLSVNLHLGPGIDSGLLKIVRGHSVRGSAEGHFLRIKNLAKEHGSQYLIIDPLSALSKDGQGIQAGHVAQRLVDWVKTTGMTLLCTSLLDPYAPESEGTPLAISTIADTWIHLSYVIDAGERNRGLSVVKSRGTGHSNQVRELVLSSDGITLTDVSTIGGEVLMGSLRIEREKEERAERLRAELQAERERERLSRELFEAEQQSQSLERRLENLRSERSELERALSERQEESNAALKKLRVFRGADPVQE